MGNDHPMAKKGSKAFLGSKEKINDKNMFSNDSGQLILCTNDDGNVYMIIVNLIFK